MSPRAPRSYASARSSWARTPAVPGRPSRAARASASTLLGLVQVAEGHQGGDQLGLPPVHGRVADAVAALQLADPGQRVAGTRRVAGAQPRLAQHQQVPLEVAGVASLLRGHHPALGEGPGLVQVASHQLRQPGDEPAGVRIQVELLADPGRAGGVLPDLGAPARAGPDLDQAAQHVKLVDAGPALDLREHRRGRPTTRRRAGRRRTRTAPPCTPSTCARSRSVLARPRAAPRPGASRAARRRPSATRPRGSSALQPGRLRCRPPASPWSPGAAGVRRGRHAGQRRPVPPPSMPPGPAAGGPSRPAGRRPPRRPAPL